jgi:hypothetical protein
MSPAAVTGPTSGGAPSTPEDGGAPSDAGTPPDADTSLDASPAGDATDAGDAGNDAALDAGGAPDATASDELMVVPAMFQGPGVPLVPIMDGDAIDLSLPPQGGHVLFIGAILRNLHTDTVKIRGRLRDPSTGAIVAEDARTVVVQPVAGDPGAAQTNIQTYTQSANVAVCPDYDARAIDGEAYVVEVTVTELYVSIPRTATASRTATPRCPAGTPDTDHCTCECAASYAIGKCPPGTKG